ncbi:TonB-dependent receptor [Cellulophaga baltica]|jgi:iron complex outermembrane receptor protein|nr:TonB-dependent receptor [Cellulophaga baltica]
MLITKNPLKMKKFFLSLLLCNTLLVVNAQDIDIKGKIIDDLGEPLSGANVIIKGTSKGAISNFDGEFSIIAPPTGILLFSSLGFASKEIKINNRTYISVQLDASAQQLAGMVVVGSRGQARTKLETASPVDVISIATQSINMPQLGLAEMLVASAPSFSAFKSQGGDLSSSVDPPTLRGLAPNQMLVLINGKRRHTSALLAASQTGSPANAVDMSFIAPESIDRVEILRDGASAQYGSDAIAGVMNVVLKKGTNKFSGSLTMGGYPNKAPDLSDTDVSEESQALLSDTEADGLNYQLSTNYGIGFENGGYLNLTGTYRQAEKTIRPNISDATPYGEAYLNNQRTDTQGNIIITNPELIAAQASGNTALASDLTTDAGLMAARGLTSKDFSTYAGSAGSKLGVISYNMALPISGETEFYSFGDFGYKYTDAFSCFFRRPAQADRANFDLYPNGFRPQIETTQTNIGFTSGIEGKLGDFDFDFSNTYGRNKMTYDMFNTFNASLQSASPTAMNLGTHSFYQNTMNFDISRYYDDILSGFNIAIGTELRVENYKILAGQAESYEAGDAGIYTATEDNEALIGPDGFPLEDLNSEPIVDVNGDPVILEYAGVSQSFNKVYSPNCQCFRGFAPGNESDAYRSVTAAYLDMELDVTKKWFVSTAFRTENYSDFGGVFTGKFATRYSIFDNFAIRGSFSSGFRAPSLQELNYSHTYTFFVGLDPFDGTLYPNTSTAAKALGIPKLTEEKSTNLSIGFTTKLFNKLELTVDAYAIDIKDRIFETSEFDASDAPVLEPIIGSGLAAFRINGGDVKTKGIEIVANYNDRIGDGMLGLMVSGVFRENTFENSNVPDLNTILSDADVEGKYVNRSSIGQFETGTPNTTLIGSATYSLGKWSSMLRGSFFGEVTTLDNTLNDAGLYDDQTFSSEFITDIGITYKATEHISLTVGGNNIFNNYPDILIAANRGFYLYSNYQQGSNGSYYFGRLSFSF